MLPQGNRGFAFALFYAVMNIAALSVGIVLDFFRVTIKRGLDIDSLPRTSLLNNGMRLFILTGTLLRPVSQTSVSHSVQVMPAIACCKHFLPLTPSSIGVSVDLVCLCSVYSPHWMRAQQVQRPNMVAIAQEAVAIQTDGRGPGPEHCMLDTEFHLTARKMRMRRRNVVIHWHLCVGDAKPGGGARGPNA